MAVRTRTKLKATEVFKTGQGSRATTTNINSGSWNWNVSEPKGRTTITSYDQIVDQLTPNFTAIVEAGQVKPVHPLTIRKDGSTGYEIFATGTSRSPGATGGYKFSHGAASKMGHNASPFSDKDRNDVALEALARFNGEAIDALTSTLEFHKTVSMVVGFRRSVLKNVMIALREWKRRKPSKIRSLKDAWDSFSNFWLEWRYGWRVLYYEYEAIVEYVENMDRGVLVVPARASIEATTTTTTVIDLNHSAIKLVRERTTLHVLRSGVVGSIDKSVVSTFNPIRTGWELIPFSFVIDWFISVGTLIDAFIPAKGRDVSLTWSSESFESIDLYRAEPAGTTYNSTISVSSVGSLTAKSVTRTVGTRATPLPPFSYQLSPGQILDLATLMKAIIGVLRTAIRR